LPTRATLVAFSIVVAGCVLALLLTAPPDPEGAAKDGFSVDRAFRHVEAIARRPRPVGSEENARVREYLLRELSALDLKTEVQGYRTTGDRPLDVKNVLGFLPGVASTGVIAVVAHYDSVRAGPGAADNGAAVAAVLEVARVLGRRGPLLNDVLFLFTDAEEVGLVGARVFVADHPRAKDVRLVLNFEARGSAGRSLMFQTGTPNEWLVRNIAEAATRPAACSIMADIYREMPNDTDFTIFDLAGVPGLNFAFVGDATTYHTAEDRPERLSKASLAHHGRNLLDALEQFGGVNLEAERGGRVVYFDVLGRWLVVYSRALVWPLTAAAALFLLGLVFVGRKERILRLRGVLYGFLAGLLVVAGALFVAWLGTRALRPLLLPVIRGPVRATPWDGWFHLLFVSVSAGVAAFFFRFAARRAGTAATHVGALSVWLALAVLAAAILPGASFLFLFPLFFALVGAFWALPFAERKPARVRILAAAFALPGIAILVPIVSEMVTALGLLGGSQLVYPLVGAGFGLVTPLFGAGQVAGRG
jgi:hypothetical protein